MSTKLGDPHSEYPDEGKLNAVYLFQDYQGMVIGRDLVMAIVQDLLEPGTSALMAWVLDPNPAFSFYAALGGSQEYEKEITIGGAAPKEIGFG